MNKRARYICFEGTEGVGKTTQTQKLVDFLRSKGYRVLQTKEPGTSHSPLTMVLRGIMLDRQYENEITPEARELISQSIRSIHLSRVVVPNLYEYDFIIQDRGLLSGLSYGTGCGFDFMALNQLSNFVTGNHIQRLESASLYSDIIYLRGDATKGLAKAKTAKKEFAAGDAMEAKGSGFMNQVQAYMDDYSQSFNTRRIDVDGKSIEQVFGEILKALDIKE